MAVLQYDEAELSISDIFSTSENNSNTTTQKNKKIKQRKHHCIVRDSMCIACSDCFRSLKKIIIVQQNLPKLCAN